MSQQEAADIERTGISIGTTIKTKFMSRFITEADTNGCYMINSDITLSRIRVAAKFINRIGTKNLIVCSGVTKADMPIEKFCEMLGVKRLTGRFMPGTLTNPSLSYYIEPKLVLVTDPQIDEQAVTEATNAGIPVIGISNTNNITSKLDIIIPANNKGIRALATVFWLLVRQILIEKGELKEDGKMQYEIDEFETKMAEEADI
ncbi:MAG: 30S ribosomal protein S2 [Nitrosopumilus sp. H8]|nr:MAG: 30S ribosomal protein S2 [Nitrosopumilus sp. H13]RNJ78673.1 MAG: 30S ribosomal protein S2 [Nitrosopumilus sp. H8]